MRGNLLLPIVGARITPGGCTAERVWDKWVLTIFTTDASNKNTNTLLFHSAVVTFFEVFVHIHRPHHSKLSISCRTGSFIHFFIWWLQGCATPYLVKTTVMFVHENKKLVGDSHTNNKQARCRYQLQDWAVHYTISWDCGFVCWTLIWGQDPPLCGDSAEVLAGWAAESQLDLDLTSVQRRKVWGGGKRWLLDMVSTLHTSGGGYGAWLCWGPGGARPSAGWGHGGSQGKALRGVLPWPQQPEGRDEELPSGTAKSGTSKPYFSSSH